MPSKSEVAGIRKELFGSIKGFTADNTAFKEGFNQQNAIIARYDEVIS